MGTRVYLGLDGGGTKTAAAILDESGRELGRGEGGPCNIATGDDETLRSSMATATEAALKSAGLPLGTPLQAVCAGVAGYTAKRRREDFAGILSHAIPAVTHRVEPDFVVAWWGATAGEPGVVVIAGTGAVVYGRNAAGEECRIDGRGWLLGDRGSGFCIGAMALSCAVAELEDGGPGPLTMRILAEIGGEDANDIVEWTYRDFDAKRVADLAQVVAAAANDGVGPARLMLGFAAKRLRSSTFRCLERLGLTERPSVFAAGSLWCAGGSLRRPFERGDDDTEHPAIRLRRLQPRHDAAYGAALLAMQP